MKLTLQIMDIKRNKIIMIYNIGCLIKGARSSKGARFNTLNKHLFKKLQMFLHHYNR